MYWITFLLGLVAGVWITVLLVTIGEAQERRARICRRLHR